MSTRFLSAGPRDSALRSNRLAVASNGYLIAGATKMLPRYLRDARPLAGGCASHSSEVR